MAGMTFGVPGTDGPFPFTFSHSIPNTGVTSPTTIDVPSQTRPTIAPVETEGTGRCSGGDVGGTVNASPSAGRSSVIGTDQTRPQGATPQEDDLRSGNALANGSNVTATTRLDAGIVLDEPDATRPAKRTKLTWAEGTNTAPVATAATHTSAGSQLSESARPRKRSLTRQISREGLNFAVRDETTTSDVDNGLTVSSYKPPYLGDPFWFLNFLGIIQACYEDNLVHTFPPGHEDLPDLLRECWKLHMCGLGLDLDSSPDEVSSIRNVDNANSELGAEDTTITQPTVGEATTSNTAPAPQPGSPVTVPQSTPTDTQPNAVAQATPAIGHPTAVPALQQPSQNSASQAAPPVIAAPAANPPANEVFTCSWDRTRCGIQVAKNKSAVVAHFQLHHPNVNISLSVQQKCNLERPSGGQCGSMVGGTRIVEHFMNKHVLA